MTGTDFILLYLLLLISSLAINLISGLICYQCDNRENRGCGIHFKSYQFKPINCGNDSMKCALQRQPPGDKNWVGILRGCYRLGQLQGINESNGCRHWENNDGFTALYCFCDADFCNTASFIVPVKYGSFISVLVTVFVAVGVFVS